MNQKSEEKWDCFHVAGDLLEVSLKIFRERSEQWRNKTKTLSWATDQDEEWHLLFNREVSSTARQTWTADCQTLSFPSLSCKTKQKDKEKKFSERVKKRCVF